jgi:hypothetical protein
VLADFSFYFQRASSGSAAGHRVERVPEELHRWSAQGDRDRGVRRISLAPRMS